MVARFLASSKSDQSTKLPPAADRNRNLWEFVNENYPTVSLPAFPAEFEQPDLSSTLDVFAGRQGHLASSKSWDP